MEQSAQGRGKVIDLAEEAPLCAECGEPSSEMYQADYAQLRESGAAAVCASCSDVRWAKAIREASLQHGFRVGV
jgi:hypothetical protein